MKVGEKRKVWYAICCLFLCLLTFGFGYRFLAVKADEVEAETNGSCILTAVPEKDEEGMAGLFASAETVANIQFDLLKGVEDGYFGVALGTGNQLASAPKAYLGVSRTGKTIAEGMKASEDLLLFLSGYRYTLAYGKGKLTISRQEYGAYEYAPVEEIYTAKIDAVALSYGIFVKSSADKSAYVLLDNITLTNADGTVKENDFNDPYVPLEGMGKTYSNDSCYASNYKGATYTVVFTDGNGTVVKIVDATEYTYAFCDGVAKEKDGKVLKGWSEDTNKVLKDMIVVPFYGEPKPQASSSSEESDKEKKGCSGVVSCGVFAALSVAGFALLKKRGNKQ